MENQDSKWGINLRTVHCPDCNEPMPKVRIPKDVHELMWGGWTCGKCGCQSGRSGEMPLAAFAIRGRQLVVYLEPKAPSKGRCCRDLASTRWVGPVFTSNALAT